MEIDGGFAYGVENGLFRRGGVRRTLYSGGYKPLLTPSLMKIMNGLPRRPLLAWIDMGVVLAPTSRS